MQGATSTDALFGADGTEAPDPPPPLPDALAEATPDPPPRVLPLPVAQPAVDHAALAAVFGDLQAPPHPRRQPPPQSPAHRPHRQAPPRPGHPPARPLSTRAPLPHLPPRPRRALRSGILVAVLVAVAALSALLASTSGPGEAPPARTGPPAFTGLTSPQNRLLTSMPSDYDLQNCTPDPSLETAGRPAGFTCSNAGLPPDAPDSANFTLYDDVEGLGGAFAQLLAANAVPATASCPAFPGSGPYGDPPDGSQVACYRTADSVSIAWTNASDRTFAIASRFDGDAAALYRWWETRGRLR